MSNPRNIPVARVAPPLAPANGTDPEDHEQSGASGAIPPEIGFGISVPLLLIGIALALYGLFADTGVSSRFGEAQNLRPLFRSLGFVVFGTGLFLAGCLSLAVGALLRRGRKE
jgi:hypothetical protein